MMAGFMMWLFQASLQASIIVIVVLVLRLLFYKLRIAKKYTCLLWLIPFLGLILPWQIENPFSIWGVIPDFKDAEWGQDYIEKENIGGSGSLEDITNGITGVWESDTSVTASEQGQLESMPHNGQTIQLHEATNENIVILKLLQIASVVWGIGVAGLLAYVVVSVVKLRKQMICCVKAEDTIYYGDDIETPFVFGLIHPRIYLPTDMDENSRRYVTEHERTHILRKDSVKKMVAFLITVVHWFNPLVWVAFSMLEKDMEMACDEETVQRIGTEKKQDYATVLLQLSASQNAFNPLGVPLAFGEGNTSGRIKNILKYKRTVGAVAVVAVVLVVVLAGLFLTKPGEAEGTNADTGLISENIGGGGKPGSEENADTIYEPSQTTDDDDTELLPLGEAELTMEKLMELCDEGSEALADHMNGFGMGDGIPYVNFEKWDVEYSLTWSYKCNLPYEDSEYMLQMIYWKEDIAEEYGHMPNELDSIILNNMTTGDGQLLYSRDTRYTQNADVRSFVEKEYDLSNYLTLDLLDGMQLGAYQVGMNDNWEGCLFEGNYEELPHGEGTPAAWYAPGGVGVCPWDESYTYGNFSAEFENDILTKVYWLNNHSARTSEFEALENCGIQALLCEYSFDLFTMAESEEYCREHGLTEDELQMVSKYWYVFFAEPDSAHAYVLFLNQEWFTKEDVIVLAKTVEF